MKQKRIFLTGFMGAGKSTVGTLLARQIGGLFIDTDSLIEQRFGMTINDFFAHFGEEFFRDCETSVLKMLCLKDIDGLLNNNGALVVATGGGMVNRAENREIMHKYGVTVYLHAYWPDIIERLQNASNRPLARNLDAEKLHALWQKRMPWYRHADIIVETGSLSADDVARLIMSRLA